MLVDLGSPISKYRHTASSPIPSPTTPHYWPTYQDNPPLALIKNSRPHQTRLKGQLLVRFSIGLPEDTKRTYNVPQA